MELTVIIPTRDRVAVLRETLARLNAQARDVRCEVIVVDDGSGDGTPDVLERDADRYDFPLSVIRQPEPAGPGAARNRALAAAQASVCLFIDDDSWPRPGLLSRHVRFHRERPGIEDAMLGLITAASSPAPTPFMRWMVSLHLDFAGIEDTENVGGIGFFTGNVSVKTAFVRSAGGFDEDQRPSHEDIELGWRLGQRGMRLAHDPLAVVEHYQPTDLATTIRRMHGIGRSLTLLVERHPDVPRPRPPGLRHRLKAAGLTALAWLGVRTSAVQHETWRFLCHQAAREAYWGGDGLRIGRRLARLAVRDEDAQMPGEQFVPVAHAADEDRPVTAR
jgi:glycosyltransferase involved in cell wall biosynthesis